MLDPILGQEGLEPSIKLALAVYMGYACFETCGRDVHVNDDPRGLRSVALLSAKTNELKSGVVVDVQQDESFPTKGYLVERA